MSGERAAATADQDAAYMQAQFDNGTFVSVEEETPEPQPERPTGRTGTTPPRPVGLF